MVPKSKTFSSIKKWTSHPYIMSTFLLSLSFLGIVDYNLTAWLEKNKDPLNDAVVELFKNASNKYVLWRSLALILIEYFVGWLWRFSRTIQDSLAKWNQEERKEKAVAKLFLRSTKNSCQIWWQLYMLRSLILSDVWCRILINRRDWLTRTL